MKPKDARPECSDFPAADDTGAHPAEASLGERFLACGISLSRSDASSRTPVPQASTGWARRSCGRLSLTRISIPTASGSARGARRMMLSSGHASSSLMTWPTRAARRMGELRM